MLQKKVCPGILQRLFEKASHDGIAIAIHVCNDLIAARVIGTGNLQIVAVKRFIDDKHILELREAVHQGGGNVSGPGPKANGIGH